MPIRMSSGYLLKGMLDIYNDEKPWLIYSMWGGYAKEGKDYTNSDVINIRNLFGNRILDGTMDGVHTSGHADVETLKEVCQTVHPRIESYLYIKMRTHDMIALVEFLHTLYSTKVMLTYMTFIFL